jgi:hypothetical protein
LIPTASHKLLHLARPLGTLLGEEADVLETLLEAVAEVEAQLRMIMKLIFNLTVTPVMHLQKHKKLTLSDARQV